MLPPALNLPLPIYTPGPRQALRELSVLPKDSNIVTMAWLVLKPRPPNPKTGTLSTRPQYLPPNPTKWYIIAKVELMWDTPLDICSNSSMDLEARPCQCANTMITDTQAWFR